MQATGDDYIFIDNLDGQHHLPRIAVHERYATGTAASAATASC